MKSILTAFLMVITIFSATPAQAQTDFNLNGDLKNKFVELTVGSLPKGVVVNVNSYLTIRKEPSIYSSEVARITNGTSVGIANGGETKNGFYYIYCIGKGWGYAHSNYIRPTSGYYNIP